MVFDKVIHYFQQFNILTNEDLEGIEQYYTVKKIAKSEFWIEDGQICKEVAFVISGILRSFYTSSEGEEHTYCITFPDNMMTAYTSFIREIPSIENIQAITDVEVLIISKEDIDKLAAKNINWMTILKMIAEEQYIELENRIFQLQRDSATTRYLQLLENKPAYIQQIPLHYLASYLGITQRHLSRIRKQILSF